MRYTHREAGSDPPCRSSDSDHAGLLTDPGAKTVRELYLDGKIRQWYSRSDGKGVILFIDVKSVDEARPLIDALPLSKASLMDDDYVPV